MNLAFIAGNEKFYIGLYIERSSIKHFFSTWED